jgi:dienelactone hydrolase
MNKMVLSKLNLVFMKKIGLSSLAVVVLLLSSKLSFAHNEGKNITYTSGQTTCKGYVAFDAHKTKMPVVLIIPEWWGCNDYVRMRADMLAGLGYFAFAVDMYGEGKIAANPQEAQDNAMKFYKDPSLAMERINAAIEKLKDFPMADAGNMAAIGYCFGGSMVLNAAKQNAPFKAVVSFHGGLAGVPAPAEIKSKILVCHGAADSFVSADEVKKFKAEMDQSKVSFRFIEYADATHAFTNPAATETGKKFNLPIAYNAEADKKSWMDMKAFLAETLAKQ